MINKHSQASCLTWDDIPTGKSCFSFLKWIYILALRKLLSCISLIHQSSWISCYNLILFNQATCNKPSSFSVYLFDNTWKNVNFCFKFFNNIHCFFFEEAYLWCFIIFNHLRIAPNAITCTCWKMHEQISCLKLYFHHICFRWLCNR